MQFCSFLCRLSRNFVFVSEADITLFVKLILEYQFQAKVRILLDLGFTGRQDYFTRFEPSQLLGGEKIGDPREKPPDRPQAELGLSHM